MAWDVLVLEVQQATQALLVLQARHLAPLMVLEVIQVLRVKLVLQAETAYLDVQVLPVNQDEMVGEPLDLQVQLDIQVLMVDQVHQVRTAVVLILAQPVELVLQVPPVIQVFQVKLVYQADKVALVPRVTLDDLVTTDDQEAEVDLVHGVLQVIKVEKVHEDQKVEHQFTSLLLHQTCVSFKVHQVFSALVAPWAQVVEMVSQDEADQWVHRVHQVHAAVTVFLVDQAEPVFQAALAVTVQVVQLADLAMPDDQVVQAQLADQVQQVQLV